jgi:MFS transporter, Spinster family, sphingosine-1-phosphate transporter
MALRSRAYGGYVIALLAGANFLNYATRNLVFPMNQDLRLRFHLDGGELGLLGSAFMVAHALVTLPVGWVADHLDRRRVLALGIAVWSAAGLAAMAAQGLGSLLAARVAAGAGTAACVPIANALLCDIFPPERKARTVSLFNLGLFIGGAAGYGIGAALGFPLGLLVVAVPGLLMAALVWRLDVPSHSPGAGLTWREFRREAAAIAAVPAMRWLLAGAVLMAFAAGGFLAWFGDLVAGTKHLSATGKLALAVAAGAGGLGGVLTGGLIGDRLQRRRPWGRMAAISMGFLLSVPFGAAALFWDATGPFLIACFLCLYFITWYHGPLAAVVDDLVPDAQATTAQAGFIFLMHLLGTAPSSWVVGRLSDEVGVRWALLVPLAAVAAAGLVIMGGWRHAGRDCAITRA